MTVLSLLPLHKDIVLKDSLESLSLGLVRSHAVHFPAHNHAMVFISRVYKLQDTHSSALIALQQGTSVQSFSDGAIGCGQFEWPVTRPASHGRRTGGFVRVGAARVHGWFLRLLLLRRSRGRGNRGWLVLELCPTRPDRQIVGGLRRFRGIDTNFNVFAGNVVNEFFLIVVLLVLLLLRIIIRALVLMLSLLLSSRESGAEGFDFGLLLLNHDLVMIGSHHEHGIGQAWRRRRSQGMLGLLLCQALAARGRVLHHLFH